MFKTAIRGDLLVHVTGGRGLSDKDHSLTPFYKNLSDPWLEVLMGKEKVLSTLVAANTLDPKWNAQGLASLCHSNDFCIVKVYEDDYVGWGFLGEATVSLKPVDEEWERNEWIPLNKGKGEVRLRLKFTPFQNPPSKIFGGEPLHTTNFYFPPRKGGSLQLYQDAHVRSLPSLETRVWSGEKKNAFEDIADTFEKATKFIYIAGWSVWTELQMRRDGNHEESLGDLLKRRAEEGVRVLVLIWNEKFSSKLCAELFGTHDFKTVKFFEGSKVTAVSVRRMPMDRSKVTENVIETIYVHHMKLIVADCPENRLIGYIGGFDLTDGRWDTPEHPIWETLNSIHKNDFYNGFVTSVTAETGPREPWHDLHTRVEGPATYDLLTIFEERWKAQVPHHLNLLVPYTEEEALESFTAPKTGRIWHMQALRSAETSSSMFKANSNVLTDFGKQQKDTSFHRGIVALIRSTKRFLYIESQYFIGSSHAWAKESSCGANNSIPIEIVEQISQGIRTGNPIRVYILIPLCPEGDASSRIGASYMCDILYWQFLTIQMMYQQIARTLREVGKDDHPENYLVFLCLGKKVRREISERAFPSPAGTNSEADAWQRRSRFIIYVHSKMALADDARIIVGSANFNQRSLDGCRDTEAGIAASQVDYLSEGDEGEIVTNGDVAEFRRCLWFEHSGGLSQENPVLADPSSEQCISLIREKAHQSLFDFVDDTVDKDVNFRFMKYPLKVDANGEVGPYPEIPNIPDFGLVVTGTRGFIPARITT